MIILKQRMYQTLQKLEVRCSIVPIMLKSLEESKQQIEAQSCSTKALKQFPKDTLKKKQIKQFVSYYQLLHPRPFHHVYKLFNTFGINEIALRNQDFQQSFLRTSFYHNIVTRVQKYKNAVVISLKPIQETLAQPSTDYFIDRLKSEGNIKSYEIACQIQQIRSLLGSIKNEKKPIVLLQDNQSITKCLNQFAGEMFIYKFGSQKIAISNELLKFMGYDVEQFAVETMKYKGVFADFLSSNSYSMIIVQALKIVKMLLITDLSKLSQQDFIQMTKLSFTDYIYSKDNKKSFCQMEYFFTPKRAVCIKVKKVIYQTDELKWVPYGGSRIGYEQQKKNMVRSEAKLYNKLGVIPDNMLQDEEQKIAGYKKKETKQM